jgi:hypothetical protein
MIDRCRADRIAEARRRRVHRSKTRLAREKGLARFGCRLLSSPVARLAPASHQQTSALRAFLFVFAGSLVPSFAGGIAAGFSCG